MQRDMRSPAPVSFSPAIVSAETESQVPEAKPSTAVATTTVAEQEVLTALETLWAENKKNRFELGKILFELQELYAVPGHGKFLEKVNAFGIPKSTAYRLIKHYKDEAGLSQTETYDRSNGAPQLASEAVVGSDLFDSIPESLRAFYSDAFREVLNTGRVWEQSYECSSPTLFRMFRMRIHLLKPQNWFVVTNALTVERSHARTARLDPNAYVDANGLITSCAHCRCSKRVDSPDQWDFVPECLQPRLESAVKVSHGLCPVCRAYSDSTNDSRWKT